MPAPEIIHQLVERFADNQPSYRSGGYNETQLRREYLDPFFEALGWDMLNRQGYAEAYKDVIHEDAIKVGGGTRAPDYAFRIGGTRKFFVEAKKPSVNIKEDISPAFQLRRYAWSAKLPLSILTDFEEFAVYDCRARPDRSDKVSTGRLMMITFRDYLAKWDEIAAAFAREAVLKGSFDRYAETTRGKHGTAEVDDAFLAEIERWRDLLARNIALRNPGLSQRELNFSVQMTIDRIIFLRIAEDRGIETYGALQGLLNGGETYARLGQLFRQADGRYNSGLFHFHAEKGQADAPDELTPTLLIDDKPLKDILKNLYYPDSPYEFSVLPADILGQVYEQFLGKVIRLTAGHHAVVEDKPEVKKAGGVFYTPTYIVDYIVKHTLGALLEGKKPGDRGVGKGEPLRVLDPACGSGSFLLGAYQYLLDWHRDGYIAGGPEKWAQGSKPRLAQTAAGEWRLTTAERKRILLEHIYGVDIDPQAVEVTKLSLLLKVLEGENEATLGKQLMMFHERALPDLGGNIQCGNSLIGPDFYQGKQASFLDAEEQYRVNAFDWGQAFPQVFTGETQGFDVVIGNPPWGATLESGEIQYFRSLFQVAKASTIDTYSLFIENSILRLKVSGMLGYIVPDTFLRKTELLPTRKLLLIKTSINELVETGPLFSRVRDTWCLIFTTQNLRPSDNKIRHRKISRYITSVEERLDHFGHGKWDYESEVLQSTWMNRPDLIIGYRTGEVEQKIIAKMEKFTRLGGLKNLYTISRGEEGSKFALIDDQNGSYEMVIPKQVEKYFIHPGMKVNESTLTQTKKVSLYNHPKIWIIRIQKMRWKQRIVCSVDERTYTAGMKTLQIIVSPTDDIQYLKYLSSILSSKLLNFWCTNFLADDMNQSYLEKIPIPSIFVDLSAKKIFQELVDFSSSMLILHRQLAAAKTPTEKTMLQRQIETTDREIDRLVYELYGLTEAEIKIVEGT